MLFVLYDIKDKIKPMGKRTKVLIVISPPQWRINPNTNPSRTMLVKGLNTPNNSFNIIPLVNNSSVKLTKNCV